MNETKTCCKCGKEKPIKDFQTKGSEPRVSSWCRECLYVTQKQRWFDRKIKAVKILGGQCRHCGYDKNLACLHLHHVDPTMKEFDWRVMRQMKWETILLELQKCILLCSNCHGEIHHPKCDKDYLIDGKTANRSLDCERILVSTGNCPTCKKEVFGTKYCSNECVHYGSRVVRRPSKEELSSLMTVMSWVKIGEQFNVSDNAVRKWAKRYELI